MSRLPLLALLAACSTQEPAPSSQPPAEAPPPHPVQRLAYNQAAQRLDLPLFWRVDEDGDGQPDPGEVVALLDFPRKEVQWVRGGTFTPDFLEADRRVRAALHGSTWPPNLPEEERHRRELVARDLDQGRPTLVYTSLAEASPAERAFVEHMLAVGELVDRLYARQNGLEDLAEKIPQDDPASHRLFWRNWGPRCAAPLTQDDPACTAIPGAPPKRVDLYPAELQDQPDFCEQLAARDDAGQLLDPFTVVRRADDGSLRAVPYTEAYGELMQRVAEELRAAAQAIEPEGEEALRAYLQAAATAFETNDWLPADEAWAAMTAENSRWYVRVAPDEVYWEPCARKAGFELSFARINPDSRRWQARLAPLQQEMEERMARAAGEPYRARQVTFHLPDFIDIVLNAGDARSPLGATIGQSLPNWGPVAEEGRGRTVAMTNLYTDPDSLQVIHAKAASLLDAEAMAHFADAPEPSLADTILHEATHNLGPAHEYRVRGKTDAVLFGGPLASLLEELKAQTGALWYLAFLEEKGAIEHDFALQCYVDGIYWALDQVARGLYAGDGSPRTYGQLAAIQLGYLQDHGALSWDPQATAADGETGAYHLELDALPGAIDQLMREVARIKATGDVQAARALKARYVDGEAKPPEVIARRILRHPKATFLYAVDLGEQAGNAGGGEAP